MTFLWFGFVLRTEDKKVIFDCSASLILTPGHGIMGYFDDMWRSTWTLTFLVCAMAQYLHCDFDASIR